MSTVHSDHQPSDQPTAARAAFGKLPILELAGTPTAGGIFYLNRSAREDISLTYR